MSNRTVEDKTLHRSLYKGSHFPEVNYVRNQTEFDFEAPGSYNNDIKLR